jgi:signal transduction histidine kinase
LLRWVSEVEKKSLFDPSMTPSQQVYYLKIKNMNMKKCILSFGLLALLTASSDATPDFHWSGLSGSGLGRQVDADSTPSVTALVDDAADLLRIKGEAAFPEFRNPGSRWRQGERYIFVLDLGGNMVVHPDPALEGKNQLGLKDVNGKPIIRGLIGAATASPQKAAGWYHYQWPVPGGLLPRWKSSYVRLVNTSAGKNYVVGSGDYDDRMERSFVVDMVENAVAKINVQGEAAFDLFYDPAGSFLVKDAYIFVIDPDGVDLVNPGFRNLEGRNIMDLKDTHGKFLIQEMFKVTKERGAGWVDYMWPKPGESISTRKSAYVSKVKVGDQLMIIGCGVYLADAPKAAAAPNKMKATALMTLVDEASTLLQEQGEKAFAAFRTKGSKWFHDETYFFIWTLDGVRVLHAMDPSIEGYDVSNLKDASGRPIGNMMLDVAASGNGAGWVHYMYPEPGSIFPSWKSSYVKRVTFPDGKRYLVGCGIYHMEMDESFIEDVVKRAADLVAAQGELAFSQLRDKTGPFVFMDTYVFVDNMAGVELVNPAQPSLEGRNMMNDRDANGKLVMREIINTAAKNGSGWVDYEWYRPGDNGVSKKHTFVKAVRHNGTSYIVGAGLYKPNGNYRIR